MLPWSWVSNPTLLLLIKMKLTQPLNHLFHKFPVIHHRRFLVLLISVFLIVRDLRERSLVMHPFCLPAPLLYSWSIKMNTLNTHSLWLTSLCYRAFKQALWALWDVKTLHYERNNPKAIHVSVVHNFSWSVPRICLNLLFISVLALAKPNAFTARKTYRHNSHTSCSEETPPSVGIGYWKGF